MPSEDQMTIDEGIANAESGLAPNGVEALSAVREAELRMTAEVYADEIAQGGGVDLPTEEDALVEEALAVGEVAAEVGTTPSSLDEAFRSVGGDVPTEPEPTGEKQFKHNYELPVPDEDVYESQYGIIVVVKDEKEQIEAFANIRALGYQVRVVTI